METIKDISDILLKEEDPNKIYPRGLPYIVEYSSDSIEVNTNDRVWSIVKSERKNIEKQLVIPLLKKLQSEDELYKDINAYSMKSFCTRTKNKGSVRSNRNTFQIALQFFYIKE